MTIYTMTDAAYFTPQMLAGAQAVNVYWGGPAATHQWSDADVKACGVLPKLPNWVPGFQATSAQARSDVIELMNFCLHYRIPRGQPIAFDLETSQADYSYMQAVSGYLLYFGFGTVVYGSKSTLGAAAPDYLWRWDADWTNVPHLNPGSRATQWTSDKLSGKAWDTSEVSQELYDRLVWR